MTSPSAEGYSVSMRVMATDVAQDIIDAIGRVCPDRGVLGALHEPVFSGREEAYVNDCVRTGWVSSVGAYVDRFEEDLASVIGVRRAVAAVNGTAALEMSLRLVGVLPGDEVIMPTLTFVGTANAVAHTGGIPHFVDSSRDTLGLDPAGLRRYLGEIADIDGSAVVNRRTGRRIAAVIPVHIFGHPVALDELVVLCSELDLPMVEDAAESLGSLYRGRAAGSFGRVAALSFNGNKIVTTGGGGAILTDDVDLADRAKHLTTTAKQAHPWRYFHDAAAWNYRLPNINAALGCAQLEQLDEFVTAKRHLAARYETEFKAVAQVDVVREPPFSISNYWLNAIALRESAIADSVLRTLHDAGIAARPAWTLMHRLPMYVNMPRGPVSVAEDIAERIINLPSGVRVARACS